MKKISLLLLATISLLNCKNDDAEIEDQKTLIVNTTIYPNPCSDYFTVEVEPKQHAYTLLLFNTTGSTVWKTEISTGTYKAEVDTLKEGLYILSIISKDTVKKKIVIAR